ncbi:topoisomerase IV [Neglecta sp. X4]|uniref:DNA gyrase/topoisomerase IV subunit A n=1 Tax=unclassified Neglectibacter TaxID=2632164 RepID=UPI00136C0E97|nr:MULTISPECIES: DNA topoisomerase (ATP-hydrolyzing) subunit A [unclassified Neglectibacter]NBI16900.1 topoisomerase IV [Neglectibacter sp. 59]NBJ72313.1 topoisomerase IV [Neglectibacter sp. X4]NCE79936.1 topoisomerase IV [Neglectibacter sp. X58]
MAGKREKKQPKAPKAKGYIAGAGEIVEQDVGETLRKNFMPYAMSVILSRAIPEIDGFKPSHRKILYTMYKMGLLGPGRKKSATIVGEVMKLNPHGDTAIYDTMVRLSRGYEALLHPFVDSKGNFGKFYSRDMAWAAPRYTEARLDDVSRELFKDIDRDTVDFVDNYDSTMQEPVLLPVGFPTVLVNANTGIAVGMASNICPFNLTEVCKTAIALLRDPQADLFETLQAPDFPGGGLLVFDKAQMEKIYETGRGSFKVRSRYAYDKGQNCIDVTQIPPTATIEVIVEKVVELVKQGKLKEIGDIRDESDLEGLKITIDLKRGTDPDKLMAKLYKMTALEDSFACNFNVLIAGAPRVLGVRALLEEWTAFRVECVRRRTHFDLRKKKEKLHLLLGLQAILLDIDKAIRIVRETEEEAEVVPNLMIGFGIDQMQAEYVAEIRLRHLNREYILKRTEETSQLEKDIQELEGILGSKTKVRNIIIAELTEIAKKYGKPRRTMLLYADEVEEAEISEEIPDYPVHLFFTQEGYFKKITPQSLRMSGEQKLKEGDAIARQVESSNAAELLFFSDKAQVYKLRASDFDDTKASVLGDYIPAKAQMDEGERTAAMVVTKDYSGFVLFVFENGKAAKVELSAYQTKTNRRKLLNAYSDKSPLVCALYLPEDREVLMTASSGRMLLFHTGLIASKTTKNTQGVQAMNLKKGQRVLSCAPFAEGDLQNPGRYRKKLPALGALPDGEETGGEQLSM